MEKETTKQHDDRMRKEGKCIYCEQLLTPENRAGKYLQICKDCSRKTLQR